MQDGAAADGPRVFLSYSHDSEAHKRQVLELANRLRRDGVDAWVDRYETSPHGGWPRWMRRQIKDAHFIAVVASEAYCRRFDGEEPVGGLGAQWEGAIITQQLYDFPTHDTKFVPLVFGRDEARHIPAVLRGATWYDVATKEGYEELYRFLVAQPAIVPPAVGPLRTSPASRAAPSAQRSKTPGPRALATIAYQLPKPVGSAHRHAKTAITEHIYNSLEAQLGHSMPPASTDFGTITVPIEWPSGSASRTGRAPRPRALLEAARALLMEDSQSALREVIARIARVRLRSHIPLILVFSSAAISRSQQRGLFRTAASTREGSHLVVFLNRNLERLSAEIGLNFNADSPSKSTWKYAQVPKPRALRRARPLSRRGSAVPVYIYGVGRTPCTREEHGSLADLLVDASSDAIRPLIRRANDASPHLGVDVLVASVQLDGRSNGAHAMRDEARGLLGTRLRSQLSNRFTHVFDETEALRIETGGTGLAAVALAARMLQSGDSSTALVVAGDIMRTKSSFLYEEADLDAVLGREALSLGLTRHAVISILLELFLKRFDGKDKDLLDFGQAFVEHQTRHALEKGNDRFHVFESARGRYPFTADAYYTGIYRPADTALPGRKPNKWATSRITNFDIGPACNGAASTPIEHRAQTIDASRSACSVEWLWSWCRSY